MQLSFEPIWDSYLLVALVVIGLGLLLWLAPLYRPLNARRQRVLTLLRVLAIVLLALALLRPTWISKARQPQRSSLLVLFDASRSMQLPDTSGSTRWESQRNALEQAAPVLRRLSDEVQLKVYAYDRQLQNVEFHAGEMRFPSAPEGQQTDIGGAIQGAVERELGQRLAAVILLGDGTQTALETSTDPQQAARQLAALGFPLYTVAFGPAQEATQARDLAVESLPDQYTVFVKNELTAEALLRVRGFANQELPVEMLIENSAGQVERVGPVQLQAREDDERVPIRLTWVPQQPGRYKLTIRAEQRPGELVTDNNELTAFVTVLEGGIRVLYLAGSLRWETRFVREAINRSPDVDLDMLHVDPQRRSEWPLDLSNYLSEGRYDVFLIGDVDASALSETSLSQIAAFVDRGSGLMMMGGFHSFGPGGYRTTPLADVLPIVMDRFERQEFDQPPRADLHFAGPLRMQPARPHPIVQLAPGDENQRLWQRLPELNGANRFFQVKNSAGVQVVAQTPAGDPLLVTGEYGRGRVLAFAGDSTWRWAMQGFESEHRRFWRQVILWLVHREELTRDDVWVKLPQRRVPLGQRLAFTAGVQAATGEPVRNASLAAQLLMPDGQRKSISLGTEAEHWRGLLDAVAQPGLYAVEVEATLDGKSLGTARADFEVLDRDLELSNPSADPAHLARLASLTQAVGGRAVAPEQLPEVLNEILRQLPESEIEIEKKWQLGDTAWDAWLLFLALVGLLGGEWALRKKWGLV